MLDDFNYDIPEYWSIFHTLNEDYDATGDTCKITTPSRSDCEECHFGYVNKCRIIIKHTPDYTDFLDSILPTIRQTRPELFI